VLHLEKSTQPALWVYGDPTLDQFCPVEKSMEAIWRLKQAGKQYEVKTFPGADHSLVKGSKRVDIEAPIFDWLKGVKP
jgi:dipeptidyl aminopeptidase/acylaminoacyl peptidase